MRSVKPKTHWETALFGRDLRIRKRYTSGVTDYFEVVDAERTALSIDLARSLASTRLIQALGGGWTR